MEFLRGLMRSKSPAQLVMIAAILLLFISQFFLYLNDGGSGYIPNGTKTTEYTDMLTTSFMAIGTGWELHPHAYVILVVLAFAFLRDDIQSSPLFARFGWWASLALVFAATLPGAALRNAIGGSMGGIAILIALAAVILHHVEARRRKPVANPATDHNR